MKRKSYKENSIKASIILSFCILTLIEIIILIGFNFPMNNIIEHMIQLMLFNVALLAFFTWNEDNKISNLGLVFEFDKKWDETIMCIDNEFNSIKENINEKKAEMKVDEYLKQLELLEKTQKKLKLLLKKIEYYEIQNTKLKSYIDIDSTVIGIRKAVNLISEINISSPEISINKQNLLELYKKNLNTIDEYVNKINSEREYEEKDKIKELIYDIESIIEENKNEENSNEDMYKSPEENNENNKYQTLIGSPVGNNRYFVPSKNNETSLIFTSRNWNEENEGKISTWYTVPKKGKKSTKDKKDYYFIVREENLNNEFPYIYISNEKLEELISKKKNEAVENNDDYYHFYFNWDKNDNNSVVRDERAEIELEKGMYRLGWAKLIDKKLYI